MDDDLLREVAEAMRVQRLPPELFPFDLLPPAGPGSILVFRGVDDDHDGSFVRAVFDHYLAVAEAQGIDVEARLCVPLIVMLPADGSLEVLDEQAMAEAGWVRR